MLLVLVLSQLASVPSVVEGGAVGWSCKTVCMACLCVYPTCIALLPMGCGAVFNVLSGSVLSPVAAETSFETPVFSSCSKQLRDVSRVKFRCFGLCCVDWHLARDYCVLLRRAIIV